jgi:hypothetical protein
MAIMRWDPFAEVDRMLELLNGRGNAGPGQPTSRGMPMDVYRDGDVRYRRQLYLGENVDTGLPGDSNATQAQGDPEESGQRTEERTEEKVPAS